MHGARLVSTPAINRIGSAVSGFDDSRWDIPVKSKGVQLGKTAKEKLPAWGWLLIACSLEVKQNNGSAPAHRPNGRLIQAYGGPLKPAGRQLVFSVSRSLPRQNLLEQIQRSRIARLPKPEQCLLSDFGILVALRDRNQSGNSFVARTL